jgi:hypothetical protein
MFWWVFLLEEEPQLWEVMIVELLIFAACEARTGAIPTLHA